MQPTHPAVYGSASYLSLLSLSHNNNYDVVHQRYRYQTSSVSDHTGTVHATLGSPAKYPETFPSAFLYSYTPTSPNSPYKKLCRKNYHTDKIPEQTKEKPN